MKKYTRELIAPLVETSRSLAEVLRKLGLRPSGSAYSNIKRHIEEYDLDTSHFKDYRAGLAPGGNKRSYADILVLGDPLDRREKGAVLTRAMVEAGVLHECAWCGNKGVWQRGRTLAHLRLHVDHVNGKGWDNRLENLRFLCPNCHDTTVTWGSTNSGKGIYEKDEDHIVITTMGGLKSAVDMGVVEMTHGGVPE